jgi:hypothetical protein
MPDLKDFSDWREFDKYFKYLLDNLSKESEADFSYNEAFLYKNKNDMFQEWICLAIWWGNATDEEKKQYLD